MHKKIGTHAFLFKSHEPYFLPPSEQRKDILLDLDKYKAHQKIYPFLLNKNMWLG